MFISALLDVTDNLDAGKVVPPKDVVRHDGDDPYLVVAADKGTATFSDIANEISKSYGFWLGDAFASGGSAGYDHKKMGITARGAWESVKRHFRDMGINTQTQDFTVVGVGDMSGDVFGNGMLLSEHIALLAAFDHRHIFLDPHPDPARSFAERRRMFDLPRSSWDDYDRSLISEGGGIFARTLKSIPISPQVRAALGLGDSVTAMSPAELMKAILLAPVDLLWNGGIGTYVKAKSESNTEVGDKANDAIRVNGAHLRCKVVGEGGNLGFTQAGRVEFARAGGHIYTDFIDNSAGVDCSDHEVNIKILLGTGVEDRDALLASMTDEVADLVLQDNYQQATTLGSSRAQSLSLLPVHRRLITELERAGKVNRALESLPTDEELVVRGEAGEGLCAPEFAVLLAYTKIVLEEEIVASDLPDEAWTNQTLVDYFPTPLRGMTQQMAAHPLRREIFTTVLVNEIVNRGGITFVHRAVEETGATAADVLRAYAVVRDVFDLPALWAAVEATDNVISTEAQTAVYLKARRLLDRAVRWLLQNRRSPMDVAGEIATLRPGVEALLPHLETLFRRRRAGSHAGPHHRAARGGRPAGAGRARHPHPLQLRPARRRRGGPQHQPGHVRGGRRLLRAVRALPRRRPADAHLPPASQRPLADPGAHGFALRPLRRAGRAHQRGARRDPGRGGAGGAGRPVGARNTASIAQAINAMGRVDASRADLAALSVLLRQIRTLVKTSSAA